MNLIFCLHASGACRSRGLCARSALVLVCTAGSARGRRNHLLPGRFADAEWCFDSDLNLLSAPHHSDCAAFLLIYTTAPTHCAGRRRRAACASRAAQGGSLQGHSASPLSLPVHLHSARKRSVANPLLYVACNAGVSVQAGSVQKGGWLQCGGLVQAGSVRSAAQCMVTQCGESSVRGGSMRSCSVGGR